MPKTEKQPEPEEARPFATWLLEQSHGRTHDELSEGLRDLVARVRDTGKKGSVQLTVIVQPLKGETDVLVVSDEIKLRLPEHDRKASLFYPDKDNNLVRNDPNQMTFDRAFGLVDTNTGEIQE